MKNVRKEIKGRIWSTVRKPLVRMESNSELSEKDFYEILYKFYWGLEEPLNNLSRNIESALDSQTID